MLFRETGEKQGNSEKNSLPSGIRYNSGLQRNQKNGEKKIRSQKTLERG